MKCAEFEVLLSDYVDGVLSGPQRRELEAHSAGCPACQELLRDVTEAVSFLSQVEPVEVPADLITRIVHHTPLGRIRHPHERRSFLGTIFGNWLQPVLQPRVAMGMAMTILSFAMLGRCTGVHVQKLSADDLSPAKVWNGLEDRVIRGKDRAVKYYENLRLVYEIESRLKDLREQQDPPAQATPAGEPKPEKGDAK